MFRKKQRGLTQEKLGFMSDIDRSYISILERGVQGASIETLFKLCRGLNISSAAFIALLEEKLKDENFLKGQL
jgi:transcriptional regulator with XRE-family HTH domain